ncbi:MAG: SGNH/GDSL hydrolase family protein [Nitrospinae bacterium]|nr:SGNH/GDSL hydrolase family protein [Nitrospinota bacterium]
MKPFPVYASDVWLYRVARETVAVVEPYYYVQPGLHTTMMVNALDNQLGAFAPEVVVLQVGIVDASPRALSEIERKVIARLPGFVQRLTHAFVRKSYARLITTRKITYVSPERFAANLDRIKQVFAPARFVVVPIGVPNEGYRRKNPLIEQNVARYNGLLAEAFGPDLLTDIFEGDVERFYTPDHHHLSAEGHAAVAASVVRRLNGLTGAGAWT